MAKSGKDAVQGAVQSVLCMVLWSFVFRVVCKRSVLVLNFAVVFLLHTLLHPDSTCVRDFGAYAHSFPRPLVTCNHLDERVRSEPSAH